MSWTKPSVKSPRRRRVVRVLVAAAALGGGFVAFMGFLHTPYGRPILARLGVSCPARKVSPTAAEALRQHGLAGLRGTSPAPARPALGLALDTSSVSEVRSWTEARGLHCKEKKTPNLHVVCMNVPAGAVSPGSSDGVIDEISFTLGPNGRLIGVDVLRQTLAAADASRLFGQISNSLTAELGTASDSAGDSAAAYLGSGTLHSARVRYLFSDYLAVVTAMNMSGRVALREQYESARGS
jgi:hypothetical protein